MGKGSKREKGKAEGKGKKVPELVLPTSEPCGICLEKIVVQGALPCCKHSYCFLCIQHWAKVTNRCPLCKQSFKFITEILPEGKEKKVKVKVKEQEHQYTLEELDEAIGDDDSEDEGPEWYFLDREADEASDDEDEEESIERQRQEGYRFYDNLQREMENFSDESSRDSRSIELSDQDWAMQDREDYSSDGGFVVDDDHLSFSESEDSLDLANRGKRRGPQKLASSSSDSSESSDSSDSSKESKKKDPEDELLENFRELMYQRRHTPRRKRLRKLAKRLSMSPNKSKEREKGSSKFSASKVSLPSFSSSASSQSISSSEVSSESEKVQTPKKNLQKKREKAAKTGPPLKQNSKREKATAPSTSKHTPIKAPTSSAKTPPSAKAPKSGETLPSAKTPPKPPASAKSSSAKPPPSAKPLQSAKPSSTKPPPSAKPKNVVLDLSVSPSHQKQSQPSISKPQNPPRHQKSNVINLVTPSPTRKLQRPHRRVEPAKTPSKVVEIPKVLSKSSITSPPTNSSGNAKRKREDDDPKKLPVAKKAKKE